MLDFITLPLTGATAAIVGAAVTVVSAIGGAMGAGAQKREAQRKERAARARRQATEANRQDIPDFQQDMLNPYANLQVATQANIMQAEQADISLASSLDTLRATGASAGGATALARAAAQSKRGVSASIEQQEAKNAELRAQGEMQSAQLRQKGQIYSAQMQEARENQQLDRQASLESSYNQQAAAYGAQKSQMIGQAVGAVGSFAMQGGFSGKTPVEKFGTQTAVSEIKPTGSVDITPKMPGIDNIKGAPGFGNYPSNISTINPVVTTNQMAGVGSLLPMPMISQSRVDPVTGEIIY